MTTTLATTQGAHGAPSQPEQADANTHEPLVSERPAPDRAVAAVATIAKLIADHVGHGMSEKCEPLAERIAALSAQHRPASSEEEAHLRTIRERDDAEDALARMFQAVTGRTAEWSSAWGFEDAIEEVDERMAGLQNQQLSDLIAAEHAPQPAASAPVGVEIASLSEAARCLGVAQAKNDQGAIDYWTAEVARYEAALGQQPRPDDGEALFYIQDTRQHVGNCPLWWCPDGKGYTTRLDEAGKYTRDEAMRQHRSRETDVPWSCDQIDAIRRPTVDMQDMRHLAPFAAQQEGA